MVPRQNSAPGYDISSPYRQLPPTPDLAPFIECYWQAQSTDRATPDRFTIIPDGCIDIVYERRDSHITCFAFGTTTRAQTIPLVPGAQYFGVRFKPGMARYFLDIPASELTDQFTELPRFLGIDHEHFLKRQPLTRRQTYLEQSLSHAIRSNNLRIEPFDQALRAVQHTQGVLRVDDLAADCGLSTRQLERRVVATVGLPPKLLFRILRMQAAVAMIRRSPAHPLAELALSAGYHDQAHMNRDLRLLTDHTPTYYRSAFASDLLASNLASLTTSDFSKT